MQECAADRGRPEADLLAYDTSHCDGVEDVGLSAAPAYQPMGMTSQAEGLVDDLSLLSVRRRYIVRDEGLILLVDEGFFLGGKAEANLCHG